MLWVDNEVGTTDLKPTGMIGLAQKASSSTGYQLLVEQLYLNGVRFSFIISS